jgi:hypothetical protein
LIWRVAKEQSLRPKASANAERENSERRSTVLTRIALVIQRPTDLDPRKPAYKERKDTASATCDQNEAIKNRPIIRSRNAEKRIHCTKDADKWGDFHRGLDWGDWYPDYVYIQLQPPKVTTRDLSRHAYNDDLIAFVKEHRRINPGVSAGEAKHDFRHFRAVIEKSG